MVSNQALGARGLAGLLILAVTFSGCAHYRHWRYNEPLPSARTAAPATRPAPTYASGTGTTNAVAQDMTATEAAIAAAGNPQTAPAVRAADTSIPIKAGAPKQYTVKRGDTLWGIAAMYLKDPWLWPEVWIINPQVPNPHLIYPGDTLALAYGADGQVRGVTLAEAGALRLDPRLRSQALDSSIPTIPYSAIAAFLARPTIMTADEMHHAPYIVAFRDMHQVAGSNNEVYVRRLSAAENTRYAVVHVEGKLRDPDDGAVVGYEGIYTATALVQRPGELTKAMLIDPARETLQGDRLVSTDNSEAPVNFTLRTPSGNVNGRIIEVVGGTELVGPWQVVVINRGKRHGLEPGDTLAIDEAGDSCTVTRCNQVRDFYRNGNSIIGSTTGFATSFAPRVKLPSERVGTLLVFKVYDRVSYGLVVGASDTIHVADLVRNP
ncbi:MAG: LysM peptidoglycan-binding domain-containing protein [Gammaproteobacteria bacterium]|nr:LysM peptidoglycan-binding domain-containing protein [Gammaproteobacteria bacterium]